MVSEYAFTIQESQYTVLHSLKNLLSQETVKIMYKLIHKQLQFNSMTVLIVSWQLTKEERELH